MKTASPFLALLLFFFLAAITAIHGQNTVGLLQYEPAESWEGYNLLYPHNQPHVYLLDNCGQIVHQWTDEDVFRPGNTAYILDNGHLVKTKRLFNSPATDPIWAGGGGAIVELRDWDNNLLWSFEQNDALRRLHHDIEPLPNGNLLMISWEYKSEEEAIAAGRDPAAMSQAALWPDYILEVDPFTDEVVWEWHAWDHLIQDFDPTKENYGVVADHPELVDLNYQTNNGHPDWMHTNAIAYHPELDQVVISVPTFSEVWVIDHSTTTEEAAGHTGGNSGRGGDLLYRWGNPLTYRRGDVSDQKLFYSHDIHWVEHPNYEGAMAVFNNRVDPSYSAVNLFTPTFDPATNNYPIGEEAWGPDVFDRTALHPDTFPLQSSGLSSVQLLPNENLLICSGRTGYSFELTPQDEIVWEYKTPIKAGNPVSQGTVLDLNDNLTFRIKRYDPDHPAFVGRNLTPQGYLELEPNLEFCDQVSSVADLHENRPLRVFPNPVRDRLTLVWSGNAPAQVEVFSLLGRRIATLALSRDTVELDVTGWAPGLYILSVNGRAIRKIVVAE